MKYSINLYENNEEPEEDEELILLACLLELNEDICEVNDEWTTSMAMIMKN